jgi:hypothetical protein
MRRNSCDLANAAESIGQGRRTAERHYFVTDLTRQRSAKVAGRDAAGVRQSDALAISLLQPHLQFIGDRSLYCTRSATVVADDRGHGMLSEA